MSDDRNDRTSDVPADLGREREAFVRQFLRRGFEITESIVTENHVLRDQMERLRDENTRLRAQIASDDAIRDLIRKIDGLEVERRELLARSDELAESSRENERRSTEVEAELHDLANLYIASSHLHSTLSLRRVVRHLAELLQQLVGAERFAIYITDPDGVRARPIHSEGLGSGKPDASGKSSGEPSAPDVTVGEGPVGLVMAMRLAKIEDQPHPAGTMEAPVAVVPMLVRDVCVGAIVVLSVFAQKERWAAVDHEFLGLLGSHGGTALIAATLYAEHFAPIAGSAIAGSAIAGSGITGPRAASPLDPRDALRSIHDHLTRQREAADAITDGNS